MRSSTSSQLQRINWRWNCVPVSCHATKYEAQSLWHQAVRSVYWQGSDMSSRDLKIRLISTGFS